MESPYPELEKPAFQTSIPSHLIKDVDPQTKFVLIQLDMINQQNQWLIKSAIDTNHQVRHTNGRLRDLEDWRDSIRSLDVEKRLRVVGILSNAWVAGSALVALFSGVAGVVTLILKLVGVI